MAVQKSKKSRSKTGMRRAQQRIAVPELSVDSYSGEVHKRHCVTEGGYYKGKLVVVAKKKPAKETS